MGLQLGCTECRDVVSADLDGEATPDETAAAETHLAGCAACRAHAQAVARVTRLTRTAPAEAGPDLVAAVVAAAPDELPPPRPSRRTVVRTGVRGGLAALGVGQLALAVNGVTTAGALTATPAGQVASHVGHATGAGSVHLLHEGSAWNLAVGVAFLLAAAGSARAGSMSAVVGTFVATLALLSVGDLVAGRVEPGRLFSHGLVVAGFLLLVWLHRAGRDDGRPAGRRLPDGARPAAHPTDDRRARDDGPDADGRGGLSPVARRVA